MSRGVLSVRCCAFDDADFNVHIHIGNIARVSPRNRRYVFRMATHGDGDVIVTDHLPGGGVLSTPTNARKIDFAPRMGRAIGCGQAGGMQIAGHEACGQSEKTTRFHKQGCEVAT